MSIKTDVEALRAQNATLKQTLEDCRAPVVAVAPPAAARPIAPLADIIREHLVDALTRAQGDITVAAQGLQISRRVLNYKIAHLGIARPFQRHGPKAGRGTVY